MPLFLPYGGATPISVDNGLFLASWVRWCELHARSSGRPNDSWDRQLMPDYGSNVTMVTRLAGDERYVWSVDILCRILAHYRDRRQTGLDFGQQNVALLEQTSTIGFHRQNHSGLPSY
jgi:hypothetical protein